MIAAVIPTRYHPPELLPLLTVLLNDGVTPILLRSEVYDHRIYRMWNAGVESARVMGADYIAILNDDVVIPDCALHGLAAALTMHPEVGVVYPNVNAPWGPLGSLDIERTTGTWGAGGMTGFAFMFRAADPLPTFDERYHWWYGDDAWERDVRALGYAVARVVGVPISHRPDGSASKDWARLRPLIEEDRARWRANLDATLELILAIGLKS